MRPTAATQPHAKTTAATRKGAAVAAPADTSREIPMLSLRATVGTIDEDERTVELVFSTGAPVERYDWWTGKRFIEKLSLKPEHMRLDRLNKGGPVLDTHSSYSIRDQIGIVVEDSVRLTAKEARATVRFSRRADVEDIWQDVRDGILKNVSVGYRVHRFEEEQGKDNKLPVRTATDWEPYEISMVPMPADTGAQTRDADTVTNPCVLVTRAAQEPSMAQQPTQQNDPPESIAERTDPLDPGAPIPPAAPVATAPVATDASRGADHENARVIGIMDACRASRMSAEFQRSLIADKAISLEEAQRRVFAELERRGYGNEGPAINATRVEVSGDDPLVHVRAGMQDAILHRLAPAQFPLTDKGRNYRGMTMYTLAETFVRARGIRTTGLTKTDVVGIALGLRGAQGYHSTSDFADLLGDVAFKSLRKAYDEAPQTWKPLVTPRTFTDFKPVSLVQLGDAPGLEEIGEGGEYTAGTISDGKVTAQLVTYGRKFSITRRAIINDDTDAFARLPMMFGRRVRAKESDLVWAQITGNPVMPDGEQLFSIAHANLAGTDAAIDITSLGAGRAALRKQTSLDGQYMNLTARYLLVGPSQETLADQYVTVVQPQVSGNVNPFQGKLQVIAEPRLEAAEPKAWWLAASPDQIDLIVAGYLDGQEGPMVESTVDTDVDGVTVRCRHDFVAKVVDHRGFYKNEGNT